MNNIIPFGPAREANVKKVFDAGSRRRLVGARLVIAAVAVLVAFAAVDLVLRLLALPDAGPPVALRSGEFDPTAEAVLYNLQAEPAVSCAGIAAGQRSAMAFIPADDVTARSALLAHCARVDRVLLEDMAFGVDVGTVIPLASDGWRADVASLGRPAFLMLTARFDAPDGSKSPLLTAPGARSRLLRDLATAWPYGTSLCLDLSGNGAAAPVEVLDLLGALRPLAVERGGQLCLVTGTDAAFLADSRVVEAVDLVVAKGFLEPGRLPLPLAPQSWFDESMISLRAHVPQGKLVAALGTFGVQTDTATGRSERIAYATAMGRTRAAGGEVTLDTETLNTTLAFRAEDGRPAQVMLLDGLSFANQLARLAPGAAVAIWPLGYEDPAVWSLLAGEEAQAALSRSIRLDTQVLLSGTGPVALRVDTAASGRRDVAVDPTTGRVVAQGYRALPAPHLMRRIDGGVPDAVLIAFDGLPLPEHLSDVLGSLARHGTRGVFSVTASEILDNRDTVRGLIAAGHAVALADTGDLDGAGAWASLSRLRDRVAAMALVGETGWRTVLAETWGPGDVLPVTAEEFGTLVALQDQGRIRLPAGERVPRDPAKAREFAERVVSTAFFAGSQLVRFDLAEDRQAATMEALPVILAEFETAGATFIAPDDLARPAGGVAMYEARDLATLRDRVYLRVLVNADSILATVFLFLLVLAIARSTVFLVLAAIRQPRDRVDPAWAPPVTVVVPAYNEEKVIATCIRSILASDYPDVRVIVVDDGSKDGTSRVVAGVAATDPRIRLVRQENAGKWAASNTALRYVETEYFIILDADSKLEWDAVRWIMQPFAAPDVGAVSGIVEVGNAGNWLTACQNLEYRVSQNIQRRAYEMFNGILVVPGAIGAWRTKAVISAGLFSGETITEDADLTLAVHRAGYRVVMAENARALTEAPEKLKSFMSQRLRWTLGMLQVSWKHRGAIAEGRTVGYVSILDAIWFSVLTTILSPLVDLIILIVLAVMALRLFAGQPVLDEGAAVFFLGYLGLTLIDVLNTLVTFRFERRFSLGLLLLTPLLRLGYRQLLYVSTLRAAWRAITGRLAAWNKLERTGAMNDKVTLGTAHPSLELSART